MCECNHYEVFGAVGCVGCGVREDGQGDGPDPVTVFERGPAVVKHRYCAVIDSETGKVMYPAGFEVYTGFGYVGTRETKPLALRFLAEQLRSEDAFCKAHDC